MPQQNIVRVILWMTGTLMSFSVMAISIRLLAGKLTVFEILAVRGFGALLILSSILLMRPGLWPALRTRRIPMHFFRSAVHFAGQYCWATALTLLPFATVFALEFTLPVWALILAVVALGEKLTTGRIVVIILGFIGCLVILRPGLIAFQPASILVLLCSFFYAVFNVATKQMTKTETTFGIVFWMNLLQFPMALAGSDPLFVLRLESWQILPIIGVGTAGLFAHYCMARAFRYGDASLVIPLDFLRVPLIALVGYLFFGESVDALVFVGAGIILAGIIWNLRQEAMDARNVALPEDEGEPEPRQLL
ncbi:DMT family transporter [Pseudorhodoplanes sp.]|uniref:DMT family transporter n=1 Tax=Pseudorhodoplanes sp. TaxID=1934341 RepID=UPI002C14FF1C|nr:DMT family transporter [Pseudorhodoplanes sp.]HWV41073.1 DMT family transporter [Pseudorhodoplanes sp.]